MQILKINIYIYEKQYSVIMRSIFKFIICTIIISSMMQSGHSQAIVMPAASPLQTVVQDFALSKISLEYSRPSAKDRKIFGGLVPYAKIWRTGANKSTRFTFNQDMFIAGKKVPAGTYALYSIPDANEWTLMLYSDLDLGGAVSGYNPDKELVRFNVKPTKLMDKVETFTIQFADVKPTSIDVELIWENTKVAFEIATEIDKSIMESIDKAMAVDARPYFQAATYYYENGKDLNKAYDWVKTATNQNPKAFWVWALKSKIENKMNNKVEAAKSANQVIQLAKDAKNDDYIKIGQDLLSQAK